MSETGHVWRLDLACGGDPVRRLTEALMALAELRAIPPGALWHLEVGHDDGCPAADGATMADCTCEVVALTARRAA